MKAREDIIIERVLRGQCPVCKESTKGWNSKNLKAEYTQINYKGLAISIHKKHLLNNKGEINLFAIVCLAALGFMLIVLLIMF